MKLASILSVALALSVVNATPLSFGLGDLGKGTFNAATGIVTKVPDVIPSPSDFFQTSKNLVAGYPFDIAARLINAFCK